MVQLLDTLHLVVREPVRRLGNRQLMNHLSIQLLVVNLTRIVDIQPLGNLQADVSAAARWVRQRMRIVCGCHKRGKARTVSCYL